MAQNYDIKSDPTWKAVSDISNTQETTRETIKHVIPLTLFFLSIAGLIGFSTSRDLLWYTVGMFGSAVLMHMSWIWCDRVFRGK